MCISLIYAAGEANASTRQPSEDRLAARSAEQIIQETNWMTVGSLVLLAVGLALLGLRFLARRER